MKYPFNTLVFISSKTSFIHIKYIVTFYERNSKEYNFSTAPKKELNKFTYLK